MADTTAAILSALEKIGAELNERMGSMETGMGELKTEMGSMRADLSKQVMVIGKQMKVLQGTTIESAVRKTVQKLYGEKYGEGFVIQGLSGISRLCVRSKSSQCEYYPRDQSKLRSFLPISTTLMSDPQQQYQGINKLKDFLFTAKSGDKALDRFFSLFPSLIPSPPVALEVFAKNPNSRTFNKEEEANRKRNLRQIEENVKGAIADQKLTSEVEPNPTNSTTTAAAEEAAENDFYDNSCEFDERNTALNSLKIFRLFLQFAQLSKDEQMQAILSDTGIAILLFCSTLDSISKLKFPIVDLELDCRGTVAQRSDGVWTVEIGEIKSSSSPQGLAKAELQLAVRLLVLHKAIKIIHGSSNPVTLEGKIFLPSSISRRDTMRKEQQLNSMVSVNNYTSTTMFLTVLPSYIINDDLLLFFILMVSRGTKML